MSLASVRRWNGILPLGLACPASRSGAEPSPSNTLDRTLFRDTIRPFFFLPPSSCEIEVSPITCFRRLRTSKIAGRWPAFVGVLAGETSLCMFWFHLFARRSIDFYLSCCPRRLVSRTHVRVTHHPHVYPCGEGFEKVVMCGPRVRNWSCLAGWLPACGRLRRTYGGKGSGNPREEATPLHRSRGHAEKREPGKMGGWRGFNRRAQQNTDDKGGERDRAKVPLKESTLEQSTSRRPNSPKPSLDQQSEWMSRNGRIE